MQIFHTHCTLPTSEVNFVTAPNIRGTLEILWTCLSILGLCTYTVLHLNVPPQEPPKGKWDVARQWRRLVTKLQWMTTTVLAPEFILGKAYSDLVSARKHRAEYDKLGELDGVEWTITHIFLANMGGFTITFSPETRDAGDGVQTQSGEDIEQGPSAAKQEPEGIRDAASNVFVGARVDSAALNQSDALIELHDLQHSETAHDAPGSIAENKSGLASHSSSPVSIESNSPPHRVTSLEVAESTAEGDDILRSHSQSGVSEDTQPLLHTENDLQAATAIDCPVRPTMTISSAMRTRWYVSQQALLRFTSKNHIWKHAERSTEKGADNHYRNSVVAKRVRSVLVNTDSDTFKNGYEKVRFVRAWSHWCLNVQALESNVWVLDACQLLLARKMGIISSLPALSKDQLDDRNKGDVVVKSLAVWQVLWLAIQVVSRAISGQATTQLEIATLSFALCTLITYGLLWNKPQDVQTPITISADRLPTKTEIARIAVSGPSLWGLHRPSQWIANNSTHCEGAHPVAHDARRAWTTAIGAVFVGLVHCLAWNFKFPSVTEQRLWRMASVVSIVMLPVSILIANLWLLRDVRARSKARDRHWFRAHFKSRKSSRPQTPPYEIRSAGEIRRSIFLTGIFLVMYVPARLYIIVEIFRTLLFSDPKTFITTWATNVPHIG